MRSGVPINFLIDFRNELYPIPDQEKLLVLMSILDIIKYGMTADIYDYGVLKYDYGISTDLFTFEDIFEKVSYKIAFVDLSELKFNCIHINRLMVHFIEY